MKRIIKVVFVMIAGSIVFVGCSKDGSTSATTNNTNGQNTSSPYIINATIGGTAFSRDSCLYYYPNLADSTEIEIVGWNGNIPASSTYYPQIYLYLTGSYHGTGTYTFSNPGQNNAQLITSATAGEYAYNGTVTITATSPNLVGTFSFTTLSGIVVSGGSFTAMR